MGSLIKKRLPWKTFRDYTFVVLGAIVQAIAMRLFLIPGQLVSGGISGAAQIINHFVVFPIGVMIFLGNLPLFLLGWKFLGGARFAVRTAIAIIVFSLSTDLLVFVLPREGIPLDNVLISLFGGLLYGFGLGMVYLGQGTSGGSDILGRILNSRLGISISAAYLITDGIVVLAGGFAFGWTKALYGLIVIYISGQAASLISEGSSIYRTAMIITTKPQKVAEEVLNSLCRGATIITGKGAYTGESRPILYVVITRSEVNQLKEVVREVDPKALMVIGVAHEALGEGFSPLRK
jgi:uncharacterized membrane-anchored protein YitT (DUF2179 family)